MIAPPVKRPVTSVTKAPLEVTHIPHDFTNYAYTPLRRQPLQPPQIPLLPLRKLQMDIPNLLIHIDILHPRRQPRGILPIRIPIIADGGLLPPRLLLLTQRLSRHAVKHVRPLRRQPLKVVRRVVIPQVSGGVARIRFGLLLFPAGVEELNCCPVRTCF